MRHFVAHALGVALAISIVFIVGSAKSPAAITAIGNVTPGPPVATGNVAAPFLIGNTLLGRLTIDGGSALSVTGGSATVGNDETGIGIVNITGASSALHSANNLQIGSSGVGSVLVQNFGLITTTGDILLGIVDGSSGSLFIDDLGSIVDAADSSVVGQAGAGLVQVTAGGQMYADETTVGQSLTGDGRITVSGHTSLWRQSNTMTVGNAGRGLLQVVSQGRVENTNTTVGVAATGIGIVEVSGLGSIWDISGFIHLGVGGNATLRILDGGRIVNSGVTRLGTTAGSTSYAEVNGLNSLWSAATTMTVGEAGFGTLKILGGGRVASTNAVLGDLAGSRGEVIVDGERSAWDVTGTLDVSDPGEAELTISNGGLVKATGVTRVAAAGRVTLAGGRLEVASASGLTNHGVVQGGGRIQAAVTNSATGRIRTQTGDALMVSGALVNSGVVDMDGGELEVLGATTNNFDIEVRHGATLCFGGAGLDLNAGSKLAVTGGAVDVFGAVDVNAGGGAIVVGGGSTAVFHDVVTNNGQLFVFPGSSVLTLESLGFAAASSLNLELGAIDAIDEVAAVEAGFATLSGTLNVQLASGYTPQLGDSFPVLTSASSLLGAFANPSLPSLSGGLSWDVEYSSNSVTLVVVPGFAADFNLDGDVDGDDLALWKAGFGTASNAGRGDGDADGDGDVDGADFLTWQRQLGGTSAIAAGAAVPEPTAAALGAIGLFAAAFLRFKGGIARHS